MGGWKLRLIVGAGIVGIAIQPSEMAHAQSFDEALFAALGRGGTGGDPYCSGPSGQYLIDTRSSGEQSPNNVLLQNFGPNLQRICRFGNTFGGSSLGSGNVFALTSSRTVSQRRASAVRQEQPAANSGVTPRRDGERPRRRTQIQPYQQLASLGGGALGFSLDQGEVYQNDFRSTIWVEAEYDEYDRKTTRFTNGYEADSGLGRAGAAGYYIPWDIGFSLEGFAGRVNGEFDGQENTISEEKLLQAFGLEAGFGLQSPDYPARFGALPRGSFGTVCLVSDDTDFKVDQVGGAMNLNKRVGGVDVGADLGYTEYKSSYNRTACIVRAENRDAIEATYHGANIGGVSQIQDRYFGLSVSVPLDFRGMILTPRVSSKYKDVKYPAYEEGGLEGVFRRVTVRPATEESGGQPSVVERIEAFDASGLELSFLEHQNESWVTSAGLSGTLVWPTGWGDVSFHGNANYNFEAKTAQQRRSFRFKEDLRPDPVTFSFQTDRPERDWIDYSVGMSLGFNSGVRPFVSVSGIGMHDYVSGWGASAGIAKTF